MDNRRTLAMLRAEAVEYAKYRWPGNVDLLEWFLNVKCPQAVGIGVKELRWFADQIELIEAAHGGDNG